MESLFPRLTSAADGDRHTMGIFGYLGFLIAWLLAPAPMAITVADIVMPSDFDVAIAGAAPLIHDFYDVDPTLTPV
jgi:hypothetical protein